VPKLLIGFEIQGGREVLSGLKVFWIHICVMAHVPLRANGERDDVLFPMRQAATNGSPWLKWQPRSSCLGVLSPRPVSPQYRRFLCTYCCRDVRPFVLEDEGGEALSTLHHLSGEEH
jgi:hypothetical protein